MTTPEVRPSDGPGCRRTPTRWRRRGQDLTKITTRLSPADGAALQAIADAYSRALGRPVSRSVLFAVAVASLADEVARGHLPRSHPEVRRW